MKKQDKRLLISSLIIALIIALALPLFSFWVYTWFYAPHPRDLSGEFPFRLEYTVNGQRHVIEDVLLTKFDSVTLIGFSTMPHPSRRLWRYSTDGGQSWSFDWDIGRESRNLARGDNWDIFFHLPNPRLLMGEDIPGWSNITLHRRGYDWDITHFRPKDDHSPLAEFGVEIINWDESAPIENDFSYFWTIYHFLRRFFQ